ncbi:leucine-rich repeat serine/threonine-protein kinase 1-like, partial [Tropilaelaps mercedesae]
ALIRAAVDDDDDGDDDGGGGGDGDGDGSDNERKHESFIYTDTQVRFAFEEIEKLGPVLNTKFVETSDPDVIDLWCGCEGGSVSVVRFRRLRPAERWSVSYTVTGSDVAAIETVPGLPDIVWSYTRPGSLIHQWDCRTRQKSHKLDCSKLIPCSESIVSIGLEEDMRPDPPGTEASSLGWFVSAKFLNVASVLGQRRWKSRVLSSGFLPS